jgi:hypothetical protein
MAKDKEPPRSAQPPRLPSPDELDQSPNWRRIRQAHEAVERLREQCLLPQTTPEGRDRLEQNQFRDDLRAVELTRQLVERRELEEPGIDTGSGADCTVSAGSDGGGSAEAAQSSSSELEEPAQSSSSEPAKPVVKRKRGRPRVNPGHLPQALEALEKKFPDMRRLPVSPEHIQFVIDFCRKAGDKLERDYTGDDETNVTVREKRDRSIRRRIEEWQKPSR